jgi:hypothetical protein
VHALSSLLYNQGNGAAVPATATTAAGADNNDSTAATDSLAITPLAKAQSAKLQSADRSDAPSPRKAIVSARRRATLMNQSPFMVNSNNSSSSSISSSVRSPVSKLQIPASRLQTPTRVQLGSNNSNSGSPRIAAMKSAAAAAVTNNGVTQSGHGSQLPVFAGAAALNDHTDDTTTAADSMSSNTTAATAVDGSSATVDDIAAAKSRGVSDGEQLASVDNTAISGDSSTTAITGATDNATGTGNSPVTSGSSALMLSKALQGQPLRDHRSYSMNDADRSVVTLILETPIIVTVTYCIRLLIPCYR